jgi:hypothetical protein
MVIALDSNVVHVGIVIPYTDGSDASLSASVTVPKVTSLIHSGDLRNHTALD